MSFTIFLGNLPAWVTADDIKGWLTAESLVADAIKVIRNPETQESKGFAFIEAPNHDEMNAIIRRFDRAPLEDRLLRANPAQPPKPRGSARPTGAAGIPPGAGGSRGHGNPSGRGGPTGDVDRSGHDNPTRRGNPSDHGNPTGGNPTAHGNPEDSGMEQRLPRRGKRAGAKRTADGGPQTAFAEELAKVL
jgi:RNA recognition motif-containing protein